MLIVNKSARGWQSLGFNKIIIFLGKESTKRRLLDGIEECIRRGKCSLLKCHLERISASKNNLFFGTD
ncbi:MAG: hypothetical protein Q8N91_01040, partial [Candidatus Omnitrophota bacterium]|nr:hypothetical protein [Candidatus Omnitrophota bacterium]